MKRRPDALRKFFSLSRWRRRFGVSGLQIAANPDDDLEPLKARIIHQGAPVLSRGSANDIQDHNAALRQEFSGQPELAFHHAMLIVLIRREVDLKATYSRYEALWKGHDEWLLKHLNIRWLVAACDTFADHSQDSTERSLGLATTLLVNSVKAYETENVMTHHTDVRYDSQVVARVQQEVIPLVEGMSCYTIGTDDTLRNMVWRMKDVASPHVTGRILMEVFQRLTTLETAYGRMRRAHTRVKTQFWD